MKRNISLFVNLIVGMHSLYALPCFAFELSPRTIYKDLGVIQMPNRQLNNVIEPARPSDIQPLNITLDVFWCSDDNQAERRLLQASELGASFATALRVSPLLIGSSTQPTLEVRTRPITKDAFLAGATAEEAKLAELNGIIRFNPQDVFSKLSADYLVRTAVSPIVPVARPSNQPSNYLSVFVCTATDTKSLVGRLFIQVKEVNQREQAERVGAVLQSQLPGISIAKEVEVVGDKAPMKSELRYFYPEDAEIASKLAQQISTATAQTVDSKQINGFENKVRRGTFEAWISKQQ